MYDQQVTLYKREDSGKLREWTIVREGNKHKTLSGLEGGAITETNWTTCHGKNYGKLNATTDDEQAELELQAKVLKKREDGFSDTGDAPTMVQGRQWTKPTLALKWKEAKHRIDYPCFTSPKLDGIRCVCNKDGMWSRTGKPLCGAPHIRKQLQPLFDANPDLVLDGELYAHDLNDNFNRICSIIKKKKPSPADLAESEKVMEYWVFDMKDPNMENRPFEARYRRYRELILDVVYDDDGPCAWKRKFKSVRAVQQFSCTSEQDVVKSCTKFIKSGFEGGMIRNRDAVYEQKRTHNLQKYKLFIDDEFEIIDIEEGIGNRSGMMGRIVMKTSQGKTFGASAKGHPPEFATATDYYIDLLHNKHNYIGKCATVSFQNYSPDRIPRIIEGVKAIRDYE